MTSQATLQTSSLSPSAAGNLQPLVQQNVQTALSTPQITVAQNAALPTAQFPQAPLLSQTQTPIAAVQNSALPTAQFPSTAKLLPQTETASHPPPAPNPQLDVEFMSEFDEKVKQKELDKLNELSRLAMKNEAMSKSISSFENMSIQTLFKNTIRVAVQILEDVLKKTKPLPEIFLSKERVVYVGIILIFLGLCLWLMFL